MEKQKKRIEINDIYKWDLTTIYKSDEDWYEDLSKVKLEVNDITNYKDALDSSKRLLQFLEFESNIDRKMSKLYCYAHLKFDEDTTNSKAEEMSDLITDLYSNYSLLSSFITPLFMSYDYDLIEKYMIEEPKIKEYEFNLKNIYRYKKYTLSESEEKIISNFSKIISNSSDTYEKLTDTDMRFGTIIDENKNEVELTESNFSKFIESKDRKVRMNAWNRLFSTYEKFKNTIASTYVGDIDSTITISKVRGYESALDASLFSDNIEKSVYTNLIDTVTSNMEPIYKYYRLKKKILGLDELHLYDIYVSMVDNFSKKYSFEEAKDIVIDTLSILGDDYVANVKKAFDEKWIDVFNNIGKRSGAYSSGVYDTNPFILLNYEENYAGVSALIHELGHSMHTYYSCKNNEYQNSRYEIFIAEVASTVNELLLSYNLYNKTDDKLEKLHILNKRLELFKATIYRQTMFAEFEKKIYEKRQSGDALTSDIISEVYYNNLKKYFGDSVVIDDLIRYEWERIPHFYYNFYVYNYATGLSAACYIVDSIINKKENAVENYIKFLSLGGSMYPMDQLKEIGIDMNKKEVIENAINMFDKTIDEFESLI